MAVVLISRGTMSGGQALARRLAERLSYRYLRREDLIRAVDSCGDHARKVRESLDRATKAYQQFSDLRRPFLILMRSALLGFIRDGNVVYDGYASHLLLVGVPGCMHVRVIAPMAQRVQSAMSRLGLGEAEAKEAVQREDEERVRWARFMYGRDLRDVSLYDACLSLDRLSVEAACSMIAASLAFDVFQPTPESARALEDLELATRVEAALVCDTRTFGYEIGAKAQGGRVHLEGPYVEDHEHELILEVARTVVGVTEVEYEPGCAGPFDAVMPRGADRKWGARA